MFRTRLGRRRGRSPTRLAARYRSQTFIVAWRQHDVGRLDRRVERDVGHRPHGGPTRFAHDPRALFAPGMRHAEAGAVRCSALIDWPVYQPLRRTMRGSAHANRDRSATRLLASRNAHNASLGGRADRARLAGIISRLALMSKRGPARLATTSDYRGNVSRPRESSESGWPLAERTR
jgi:hypothetical protein